MVSIVCLQEAKCLTDLQASTPLQSIGYFFLLSAADCAALIKSLAKDLSVNEMVRPVIEDLFAFMPFAGNEDNVSRLRQQTGGLYGVFPIGDTDCLLQIVFVQACQHVIDDVLRLFEAGIVGSDDNTVAQTGGLLGHDRTFPFVAVATCANYGYHFSPACQYVVDGIQ
ncbi:hypothetical protein, partial [Sutterella wadsworthensis]|uniref:hypothetical protein n=1 Tax=Sutterella wadsworthensis TaxID=40545 RepID=UPI003C704456